MNITNCIITLLGRHYHQFENELKVEKIYTYEAWPLDGMRAIRVVGIFSTNP